MTQCHYNDCYYFYYPSFDDCHFLYWVSQPIWRLDFTLVQWYMGNPDTFVTGIPIIVNNFEGHTPRVNKKKIGPLTPRSTLWFQHSLCISLLPLLQESFISKISKPLGIFLNFIEQTPLWQTPRDIWSAFVVLKFCCMKYCLKPKPWLRNIFLTRIL